MTVSAFSLPAVLPGAPLPSTGVGAVAPSDAAGLFASLLSGAVQAEQGGRSAKAGALDATPMPEAIKADETTPGADAGVALLLFTPAAAPTLPTPAPVAEDAPDAPFISGAGLRAFGPSRTATAPLPANDLFTDFNFDVAGEATDAATVAPAASETTDAPATPIRLSDLAGFAAPQSAQAPAPAFARTSDLAPVAPPTVATPTAAPQSDAVKSQVSAPVDAPVARATASAPPTIAPVSVAEAGPSPVAPPASAPAPVVQAAMTPVVVAPAVAPTATVAGDVETVAPAVLPVAGKVVPTEGDIRRGPASARGDRRETAVRNGAAPLSPFAPKPEASTMISADATAVEADAEAASDLTVAVADIAEPAEARQPAAIAETRVQTAQAAAAVVDAAVPRGSPETVARMAADIIRKLDGQSTRFDVQLDPHGMGKVDVAIEINRDGKLTAAMSFDSAQSAADLRGRAGELRLALEKAGFDIADGGLTFDLSGQNAGFSGREAGQQDRAWNGRAFQRAQSGADEADLSLAATPSTPSRWTRSGVDIRI